MIRPADVFQSEVFVSHSCTAHLWKSFIFNITQLSMLLVPVILTWFFKEFYKGNP